MLPFLLYSLLIFPLGLLHYSQADPSFRGQYDVTHVKCHDLDPTYVKFVQCELKIVGKTKLFNMRNKILKPPINDVLVRITFLRATPNANQPLMFNVSIDFCKYKKGTRRNFLFDLFYKPISNYSNLLYPCPYTTDVYIQKFPVNSLKTVAGFFSGAYKMHIVIICYKKPRAALEFAFNFL